MGEDQQGVVITTEMTNDDLPEGIVVPPPPIGVKITVEARVFDSELVRKVVEVCREHVPSTEVWA